MHYCILSPSTKKKLKKGENCQLYLFFSSLVMNDVISLPDAKGGFLDSVRIWNTELIYFAGYEREDGSVLGDKSSVKLTKVERKDFYIHTYVS